MSNSNSDLYKITDTNIGYDRSKISNSDPDSDSRFQLQFLNTT